MTDNIFETHEKIYRAYRQIVEKYFSEIPSDGSGATGPNFEYYFSRKFKNYKRTEYYYQGEFKFIHWTTLSNLFSIINNKEIRLYNLMNAKDEKEFSYVGEILLLNPKQIEIFKNNFYYTSFCSAEHIYNKHLWKKYGRNLKGIAIEFSLVDNRDEWEDFFLSEIFYKVEPRLRKYSKEIKILNQQYNNELSFLTDIYRFSGFYKRRHYKSECEVRLAAIFPSKNVQQEETFIMKELKKVNKKWKVVKYLPLKLWHDPNSSYTSVLDINKIQYGTTDYAFDNRPQIKIEKIYFGENALDENTFWELYNELKKIFSWRLWNDVEIDLIRTSQLR